MSRRPGTALLMLVVMLLPAAPVIAHDIGVSRTELLETTSGDDRAYTLRVAAKMAATAMFAPPILPERCVFQGNPRGVQGPGWKSFGFVCAGGLTADDRMVLPWRRDGIMLLAKWADGSEVRGLFKNVSGVITVPLVDLRVGSGSWAAAAKRYTALGITHILEGYDHLLFVLALLIIVNGGWLLVKTITAFTVAHSFTLALAALGFVNVPPRPVEAVIALSIVFLAAEIVHAHQGRIGLAFRSPWVVAFSFGLLHGFGFAGALSDIGLPHGEVPVALLFFNVGVEIGQLLFVLGVIVLRWLVCLAQPKWPEWSAILPAYAIGTMAMFWTLQRVAAVLLPA